MNVFTVGNSIEAPNISKHRTEEHSTMYPPLSTHRQKGGSACPGMSLIRTAELQFIDPPSPYQPSFSRGDKTPEEASLWEKRSVRLPVSLTSGHSHSAPPFWSLQGERTHHRKELTAAYLVAARKQSKRRRLRFQYLLQVLDDIIFFQGTKASQWYCGLCRRHREHKEV